MPKLLLRLIINPDTILLACNSVAKNFLPMVSWLTPVDALILCSLGGMGCALGATSNLSKADAVEFRNLVSQEND